MWFINPAVSADHWLVEPTCIIATGAWLLAVYLLSTKLKTYFAHKHDSQDLRLDLASLRAELRIAAMNTTGVEVVVVKTGADRKNDGHPK